MGTVFLGGDDGDDDDDCEEEGLGIGRLSVLKNAVIHICAIS